jgi:hypothetical protein
LEFHLQAAERGCPQPQRPQTLDVLRVKTPALRRNRLKAELQTGENKFQVGVFIPLPIIPMTILPNCRNLFLSFAPRTD